MGFMLGYFGYIFLQAKISQTAYKNFQGVKMIAGISQLGTLFTTARLQGS